MFRLMVLRLTLFFRSELPTHRAQPDSLDGQPGMSGPHAGGTEIAVGEAVKDQVG